MGDPKARESLEAMHDFGRAADGAPTPEISMPWAGARSVSIQTAGNTKTCLPQN